MDIKNQIETAKNISAKMHQSINKTKSQLGQIMEQKRSSYNQNPKAIENSSEN